MIGLDTNVLARYYIDDDAGAPAQRQRLAARRLIESGQPLMVCKSVILELEGVMRGYYSFALAEVVSVMRHLLEQIHITVEDRESVEQALSNCAAGIDFADALHHASYRSCASVASFDDRKFARRAKKLGLAPAIVVLSQWLSQWLTEQLAKRVAPAATEPSELMLPVLGPARGALPMSPFRRVCSSPDIGEPALSAAAICSHDF